jgi:FkbM family methyltransferase
MPVSRYTLKKAVLTPHTIYRRRRSRGLDPVAIALLEAQYYRPTMYDFMQATSDDADLLVDADLDAGGIVLDIGAYIGEWSEQIAKRYGARVFAFEPSPQAFKAAEARLAGLPTVRTYPFGLAATDTAARLALEGPGSTVYQPTGTFGVVDVQLRDVAGVLDELGLAHVDVIKVNIEGGEYDLFDRLIDTGWVTRLADIRIQFHEWHPNAYARRRAIQRELRRTHEKLWDYPFVWERWRRR